MAFSMNTKGRTPRRKSNQQNVKTMYKKQFKKAATPEVKNNSTPEPSRALVLNPSGEIVVTQPIMPIMTPKQARDIYTQYQELCEAIITEGDIVDIKGKWHPTKQFANKLARMFGLNVEIVKAEKEAVTKRVTNPDGSVKDSTVVGWHIVVRASAPNGQYRDGDGHCSSTERQFAHWFHDIYAQAVTRAKNRAILELVGMGTIKGKKGKVVEQVSAEEIESAVEPKTGKPIEEVEIPVIN